MKLQVKDGEVVSVPPAGVETVKLTLGKVVVQTYKTGERDGEPKPFEIPADATIVSVSSLGGIYLVYYTQPAGRS